MADLEEFQRELPSQIIESMGRRGKYLLFYLTDKVLISHLRMEGKYFYYPDQGPERKHAHVFFHFEDGGTLVYEDVRKFGTMELLVPDLLDAYFISKKLGPEPSEQDFDLQVFQSCFGSSCRSRAKCFHFCSAGMCFHFNRYLFLCDGGNRRFKRVTS